MKIVYNGENDTRLFKDVLGSTISRLCTEDPDIIYLDADLMSCIGTTKWAKEDPVHAINCGVAEANMVGVACGLASAGLKPIVHTFGPFASRRCFDQSFLSGGYAKNAITIIGSDPGVCAAYNGGTHMPFEDMALYRAMPEATVIDITDANMLIDVLEQAGDMPGVKYIRVGRKSAPKFYADDSNFLIGRGIVLREGKDATIISCGIMTGKAMQAAEILANEGINVTVVDMFTVKPLDEELVVHYAKLTGAIVTCENHNKIGGLTAAVCETLALKCPTPLEYVAVEDVFGEVGPQDYLEEAFGLTYDHIIRSVKAVILRK